MADDLKLLKAEAAAKHRVAVYRMGRRWREEGYDPRGHLQAMTADGDKYILIGWCRDEQDGPRPVAVACWLALQDMMDMMRIPRR